MPGLVVERLIDPPNALAVVDTTGCGNSFAAGMAYGYFAHEDIAEAARYGNAMGAQRGMATELTGYLPLRETERQISETYPVASRA